MFKALSTTIYTVLLFLSAIFQNITPIVARARDNRPCTQECTLYWNPVCGSDGTTYRNTACLSACNNANLNLQVQHEGVCCTDPGELKFGGTCLYFSGEDDQVDYDKAKDSCEAKDGRLAILANNPNEAASFINNNKGGASFWVGGKYCPIIGSGEDFWVSGNSYTSSESNWKWDNGIYITLDSSLFPWDDNEPNGEGSTECLYMHENGKINDGACTRPRRYICEKGRFSRCPTSCTQYKNTACIEAYACNHPYLKLQVQYEGECRTETRTEPPPWQLKDGLVDIVDIFDVNKSAHDLILVLEKRLQQLSIPP